MSFDTIVTVPTDGGNFNFHAKNFAWEKIDDNHTLIVYAQTNPVRLYARIVTFNGAATPTLGDAYSIVSPANVISYEMRENFTRLYPRVAFLDEPRTSAIVFFRSQPNGNQLNSGELYYDTQWYGQSDLLSYVVCDVDVVNDSVVPVSEPKTFSWVTSMSYDLKSKSEFTDPNYARNMCITFRNGTHSYLWRASTVSNGTVSWVSIWDYSSATNSESFVGGSRITKPTQNGYDKFVVTSNDQNWQHYSGYSGTATRNAYFNSSSVTSAQYYTRWDNQASPASLKIATEGVDCITSLTPTVCVFARGNAVCTKSMASSNATSYDSVHTDILPGMNAGEQIGQIMRINDTTFMAIQRNPTLGGAAKIWVFGTGWSTLPPVIDFNTNNPFTVNNFPCDVPNGAETDAYQYNNTDTWKNMSWNDVAQWDDTNKLMRVYGVIDDGAGNPVLGIRLVVPTV